MIRKLIDKLNNKDPDSYHFRMSLTKSGLRIAAGLCFIAGLFVTAGVLLIVAEIYGIVEEL